MMNIMLFSQKKLVVLLATERSEGEAKAKRRRSERPEGNETFDQREKSTFAGGESDHDLDNFFETRKF